MTIKNVKNAKIINRKFPQRHQSWKRHGEPTIHVSHQVSDIVSDPI